MACLFLISFCELDYTLSALPTPWSRLAALALVAGGDRSAPTEAGSETGSRQSATGARSTTVQGRSRNRRVRLLVCLRALFHNLVKRRGDPLHILFCVIFSKRNAYRAGSVFLIQPDGLEHVGYPSACTVAGRSSGNTDPHQVHAVKDRFSILAWERQTQKPRQPSVSPILHIGDPTCPKSLDQLLLQSEDMALVRR